MTRRRTNNSMSSVSAGGSSAMEEELIEYIAPKARRSNTRKTKQALGIPKEVKEKFIPVEGEAPYIAPVDGMKFSPIGANQKKAMQYMREGRQVVALCGVAGSGKSMLATYHAAELLKGKKIDKIYLTRANVSCGKSNGALPGDIFQKSYPFVAQTIRHLEKFLGVGFTKYCLDKKIIEVVAIEFLRGTSFENCVVILEEAQALTKEELEMMLTRIGQGAQLIFTGDEAQTDIKNSGLSFTLEMFDRARKERPEYLTQDDIMEITNNIGLVRFVFDDIQRSGLVKAFTKLYYYQ